MKSNNDYFKTDADKEIVKALLKANDEYNPEEDLPIPYIDREKELEDIKRGLLARREKKNDKALEDKSK